MLVRESHLRRIIRETVISEWYRNVGEGDDDDPGGPQQEVQNEAHLQEVLKSVSSGPEHKKIGLIPQRVGETAAGTEQDRHDQGPLVEASGVGNRQGHRRENDRNRDRKPRTGSDDDRPDADRFPPARGLAHRAAAR